MGNKSASLCAKSKRQILQDDFQMFQFSQSLIENQQKFQNGQPITVSGNSSIKCKLFRTHFLTNPTKQQSEIQTYFMRHKKQQQTSLPFVKVYGTKLIEKSNMCSINKYFFVITQDFTLWKTLQRNLKFQQALYVLFHSVLGFSKLYQKYGFFQITQNMIVLNSKGHLKVWFNQNFGQNHPQNQRPRLQIATDITRANSQRQYQPNKQQQSMINKLFQIIQTKYRSELYSQQQVSFKNTLLIALSSYLRSSQTSEPQILNFKQLLNALSQYQQTNFNSIFIPNRLFNNLNQQIKILESQNIKEGHTSSRVKQYDPLRPRQSFLLKIKRAQEECREQQQMENKRKKQLQQIKYRMQQQMLLDKSRQTSFSTGSDGNTMKKYSKKIPTFSYTSPDYHHMRTQSQSLYLFGSYGPNYGLAESYLHNINLVSSQFPQIQRTYSTNTLVRELEHKTLGSQGEQYIYTYIPTGTYQEYERQMQEKYYKTYGTTGFEDKNLKDTHFKSTLSGNNFYSHQNDSIGQGTNHKNTFSNLKQRQFQKPLIHSNSQWINIKPNTNQITSQPISTKSQKKNQTAPNVFFKSSSYKKYIQQNYLMDNTSSKKNENRISEDNNESMQESFRQSLANYNKMNSNKKQSSFGGNQSSFDRKVENPLKQRQFGKIKSNHTSPFNNDRVTFVNQDNFLIKEQQPQQNSSSKIEYQMSTPNRVGNEISQFKNQQNNVPKQNQVNYMLSSQYNNSVNNSIFPWNAPKNNDEYNTGGSFKKDKISK